MIEKLKNRYRKNKGLYLFIPFLIGITLLSLGFGAYQKHRRDQLCLKYDCEEILARQRFINIIEGQYEQQGR